MQHCQIVLSLLLVTGGDAAKLLQPINRSLYLVAQPVQDSIERAGPPFIYFPGDGVSNPSPPEISANLPAAVPLITADPLGSYPRTATTWPFYHPVGHQLFEHSGLMLLARGQYEGYRLSLTFYSYVDLGSEASLGAA